MAEIFDRETLLDLTVNIIPLAIILFFIGMFVFTDPFPGLSRLGFLITLGLHVVPLVGLGLLTYVAGKAIAGDEKRSEVFFQGQAAIDDAPTREEARSSFDRHVEQENRDSEPADTAVQDDESATAEQEEEPAHRDEEEAPGDATEEPAPPKDVDETGEAEGEGGESDGEMAETLDQQTDGEYDPDESAAEKGERAEGTVADEDEQAADDEPVAGDDEQAAADEDDDDRAE